MLTPTPQRGVSLLEVLVALAIFGIGAIGISGWMLLAARATQTAYLRTQASLLAGDMVERMHANLAGVQAGAYDGEAKAGAASCGAATACMPAALATHDLAVWATRLRTVLPEGRGVIHCEQDTGFARLAEPPGMRRPFGGLCTMTVRWLERGTGGQGHREPSPRIFAWVFQP